MNTILAASDLSENSAVALRRAAQLVREHGAQLELLHVVETLPQEDIPAPLRALVAASPLGPSFPETGSAARRRAWPRPSSAGR